MVTPRPATLPALDRATAVAPHPACLKTRQLFRQSSYLDLRALKCEYEEGALVLSGRVPSFFLKQMAQTIARQADHDARIVNRVEVTRN